MHSELSFQRLPNICFLWLASNTEATTKTNGLCADSYSVVVAQVLNSKYKKIKKSKKKKNMYKREELE
jgi:hypothetical protein